MNRAMIPYLFLFFLFVSSVSVCATPNLNGPSGLITMPTAYLGSGISTHAYGGYRFYKYSQVIMSGMVEAGVIQNRTLGDESYHAKLAIMNENLLPAISFGMVDISDDNRESSNYLVMSKNFGLLGLTLHGGYYKAGKIKNNLGIINYNLPYKSVSELYSDKNIIFLGSSILYFHCFRLWQNGLIKPQIWALDSVPLLVLRWIGITLI